MMHKFLITSLRVIQIYPVKNIYYVFTGRENITKYICIQREMIPDTEKNGIKYIIFFLNINSINYFNQR